MVSTRELWNRESIRWGLSLVLLSLILNYVIFGYRPGTLVDVFLATSMFLLGLTGIVLFFTGIWRPFDIVLSLLLALAIAVPASVLFAASYFAVQFFETGGDKYGECPGLVDAAGVSHDIPASRFFPTKLAAYCGNGRSGMFLWPYDSLAIYGVTDPVAQNRISKNISLYRDEARTFPVRVTFYDQENWIQHKGKDGPGWGERGPEKVIKTAIFR